MGNQCKKATAQAMSVLDIITRTFPLLLQMGLNCYTMLYRPHLEFCVQAWSLYLKKTLNVQRRCSVGQQKWVYGFGNLMYEERLERLNLFLLQYRRMRGDMIDTYKIISDLEDVNSSQFFTRSDINNLHGHSLKLYKEHFRKVICKKFFLRG